MNRIEVKSFEMKDGVQSAERTVPFSAYSFGDFDRGASWTVSSSVTVDGRALENKFLYLRISDAEGLNTVRINGAVAFQRVVCERVININAKSFLRVGQNTLEFSFSDTQSASVCGIFGSVELLCFNGAAIDKVGLTQRFDGGAANLDITLDLIGLSDSVRAVATLVSGAGHVYYGGITRGRGTITVKDPLIWWPKGMGVQNLYKLTVNIYGEMEIEDTLERRVGIRNVRADGKAAVSFGGVDMLPMGAVYRTEDRKDPFLARNRQSAVVTYAAMASFNTLIISPDDPLPDDAFFDLCDAHGIAVIREVYTSSLEKSTEPDVLARISNHPSMAVYHLIHDTGNAKSLRERLNHIAPSVAVKVSDDRPKHFGYPSMPTDKVIAASVPREERNLFSKDVESYGRDKILDILAGASERFPYAASFDDFLYLSGICAAEKVQENILDARIKREGCAVYDCLADTTEGIFSSGIDSSATWKPLHYYAMNFFAPLVLVPKHLGGGRVEFYVSNERRQGFVGTLEYRLIDNKNKVVYTSGEQCVIERNCSKLITERNFADLIRGHENEYYLDCVLRDPLGIYSPVSMLFVPEKHFKLLPPEIEATVTGSDKRFCITVSAGAYARGVEIGFTDRDAIFSTNYFDLKSPAPVKVTFNLMGGFETAEHLNRTLVVRSLYDLKKSR